MLSFTAKQLRKGDLIHQYPDVHVYCEKNLQIITVSIFTRKSDIKRPVMLAFRTVDFIDT